jgi:glutathione S-transferase
MPIELWWAPRSPYCWRVQLALAYKGLVHESHSVDIARQEQKSPHLRRLTPRGRVPVLREDDYVVFESVAILYYLDRKHPDRPLFGATPEEGGVIVRVIEEFQSYIEPHLAAVFAGIASASDAGAHERILEHLLAAAGEARVIEGRLAGSEWVVGVAPSAADFVIYPWIALLLELLEGPAAGELRARFLPVEVQYPALARWLARLESLPGLAGTRRLHLADRES